MNKIRAVYMGDVRFSKCPVFELNSKKDIFEMIEDRSFWYPRKAVYDDNNFFIFVVRGVEDPTSAEAIFLQRGGK